MGMPIFLTLIGSALLLLGRKLFWLLVGAAGFAVGFQFCALLFESQPLWILWIVGLSFGIIGALLALFFQQVAVAVGGFLAGGTVAHYLMQPVAQYADGWIVLIAGIAGAVAMVLIFDWALIALSALLGASFIIEAVGWRLPHASLLFAVLVLAGVLFQARWLNRSRGKET